MTKESNLPGLEPGIFCSVGRRVIHCATGPVGGFSINKKYITVEQRNALFLEMFKFRATLILR